MLDIRIRKHFITNKLIVNIHITLKYKARESMNVNFGFFFKTRCEYHAFYVN